MKNTSHRLGFTLIELSIVLVIIGLIAGGVLAGRELIYQSQLRKINTEVEGFKASVYTFKLKYNCLPGDCANAFAFFDTNCSASAAACNGNDDGNINPQDSQQRMTAPQETYMFWKHLNLADIAPHVTGIAASGPAVQVGVNIPASKAFTNAGYSVIANIATSGTYQGRPGMNTVVLGSNNPASDTLYHAHNPLFSAQQMQEIDSKFDDGTPTGGNIAGMPGYGGNSYYPCLTSTAPSTMNYNLTTTALNCSLYYFRAF